MGAQVPQSTSTPGRRFWNAVVEIVQQDRQSKQNKSLLNVKCKMLANSDPPTPEGSRNRSRKTGPTKFGPIPRLIVGQADFFTI